MARTILPNIGSFGLFNGTNPAAAVEVVETVPAGHAWLVSSVAVPLAQGATQTPQPILVVDEGTGSTTSLGTVTVTIATPGLFTLNGHGLAAGDIVFLKTTIALPTGLAANTVYYVIAAGLTSNDFEVALTRGGTAINTTGTQSGVHTLYQSAVLYEGYGSSAAMGVNTTCQYVWAPGLTLSAQVGATTNVHSSAPLPEELVLIAGNRINTNTLGLGANSNYGRPAIRIYDMPTYP